MPHHQDDLQQFEALFKRLYQRFCHRVQRITNDMDVAEDIVQEVFVNFWNDPSRKVIEVPEAYLYKACLNKALNHVSTVNRRARLVENFAANQWKEARSPEQEMEFLQLQDQIQQTIHALPPMCQKVFLLSRYEGMSHKEIADFLSISHNTVDNHIKKALASLRKLLISLVLLQQLYLFLIGN